jgi:hypothetical protein
VVSSFHETTTLHYAQLLMSLCLETKILWGAQRRSIADKRGMVEATWLGPIRARVAWAHGVNANQLFGWLRLYLNAATPVIELTPVLL